jgi:hypothetical protein
MTEQPYSLTDLLLWSHTTVFSLIQGGWIWSNTAAASVYESPRNIFKITQYTQIIYPFEGQSLLFHSNITPWSFPRAPWFLPSCTMVTDFKITDLFLFSSPRSMLLNTTCYKYYMNLCTKRNTFHPKQKRSPQRNQKVLR